MKHLGIYRDPFSIGSPTVMRFPPGLTVDKIVERMPDLPRGFSEVGEVRIDDKTVPREWWRFVRPDASARTKPAIVTFHAPIHGDGDEEGGKNPVATIAALVIAVAATAATGGAGAALGLGAAFQAGGTGAIIAGAAISLIGGLILYAITAPPTPVDAPVEASDQDRRGAASANGNVLDPNGPVPRVIGTRKVFPPLAAEPYVFFENGNEVVEAVFALAGPHSLTDIRVDGSPIDDAAEVYYETREGWQGDAPLEDFCTQAVSAPLRTQLSAHLVQSEEQQRLIDREASSYPAFHGTTTRYDPEEVLLHLVFPSGISLDGVTTTRLRVAFRIRIKRTIDANWINLPELHYEEATLRELRTTIRLKFQDGEETTITNVPQSAGWVEARKESAAQVTSPGSDGWSADSYFSDGAGNDYLVKGTEETTNLLNVNLSEEEATIYLDRASFATGTYQVEIKRSAAFKASLWDETVYEYDSEVRDPFIYAEDGSGNALVIEDRTNMQDIIYLTRMVSLWNEPPVAEAGFALIAIRAVNRPVERVSVVASGYVKDWSGSAWDNWTTTSNPAPHYRDILVGAQNLDPLPVALIDDTGLVEWRTACANLDYTCDHIAEGDRIQDVRNIVASCGYARPYQSEVWGITRDLDRSTFSPVQIFTPRNSRGFKWSKAFGRLADGLRLNLQDADVEYAPSQLLVYHEGIPGPLIEQAKYEGLPDLAKARKRALFDLAQARERATIYTLTAPSGAIRCRRGSLVGVHQDVLVRQYGAARIASVTTSGGNVTGVVLDTPVDVYNEDDMHAVTDMHGVTDMHTVGLHTSIAIRQTDGETTVHTISTATAETDTLTFDSAVTNATTAGGPFDGATIPKIDEGCLVAVGIAGEEYRRLIVTSVDPGPDLTALLTMVDEAPALWPSQWWLGFTSPSGIEAEFVADFENDRYAIAGDEVTFATLFPDYARASSATYRNGLGVLATASSGAHRLEYDVNRNLVGIVSEPASTNICLQSEDFSTTWSAGADAALDANATGAPDGNTTADRIKDDSGGGTSANVGYSQSISGLSTSGWKNFSVFLTADGNDWAYLALTNYGAKDIDGYFNLATGAVGTTGADVLAARIQEWGGGWWRCCLAFASDGSDTSADFAVHVADADTDHTVARDGTSSIFAWGAQVEQIEQMTSYIPTTTTSVTRAIEVIENQLQDFTWNEEAGGFHVRSNTDYEDRSSNINLARVAVSSTNHHLVRLDAIASRTGSGRYDCYDSTFGLVTVHTGTTTYAPGLGVELDVAAAFDASTIGVSAEGEAADTDTSPADLPAFVGTDVFRVSDQSLNAPAVHRFRSVAYYNSRLTDADLATMTT